MLGLGRVRPRDVKGVSELQNKETARRKSVADRLDVSPGHKRELGEAGGDPAFPAEKLDGTRVAEVPERIRQVEGDSPSSEHLLGRVQLPREFEPFRGRRAEAPSLETLGREADHEAVVSSIAKVRLEQAAELAMDWHEDEPRPISPVALEMLPPGDARKARHELGRSLHEITETRSSPKLSHPAQAYESAPLSWRQPERLRELKKQVDVPGPSVALGRRAATEELEPSRVHAMRDVVSTACSDLVDEPLCAVKALSIKLRGEIPPEAALDRCYLVLHERFTSQSRYLGGTSSGRTRSLAARCASGLSAIESKFAERSVSIDAAYMSVCACMLLNAMAWRACAWPLSCSW